jgi:hypothetical protein
MAKDTSWPDEGERRGCALPTAEQDFGDVWAAFFEDLVDVVGGEADGVDSIPKFLKFRPSRDDLFWASFPNPAIAGA